MESTSDRGTCNRHFFRQEEHSVTHSLTTTEKTFYKARATRLLCSSLLATVMLPVAEVAPIFGIKIPPDTANGD